MQNPYLPDAINTTATPQGDRLLTFREVNELIGSSCRTGHTARALFKRGQLRGVYINARTLRYSLASVRELIAGRVDAVAAPRTAGKEDVSDE